MENTNFYEGKIRIVPKNKEIYALLNLNYYVLQDSTEEINLYIYKDINIDQITSEDVKDYAVSNEISNWSPFILESKQIKIHLNKKKNKGDVIRIQFKYHGKINTLRKYEVNRISEEWVEISLYSPWFPLAEENRKAAFQIRVNIEDGYEVVGQKTRKHNGYWIVESDSMVNDCTILASKNFKKRIVQEQGMTIKIYNASIEGEKIAEKIEKHLGFIIKTCFEYFGKTNVEEFTIVVAPRSEGGGYCRPGLLVVALEDGDDKNYFKFLAHEISHLWWMGADSSTWEDWLNESFAEYSALLLYREKYGNDEFEKTIEKYRQAIINCPPIYGLSRSDEKAFLTLYAKGPVILNKLEKKIGTNNFKKLLKELLLKNIKTTAGFFKTVKNMFGEDTAKFIEKELKS